MCCGCTHRRITASLITASLLTFLARLGLLKASRSHGPTESESVMSVMSESCSWFMDSCIMLSYHELIMSWNVHFQFPVWPVWGRGNTVTRPQEEGIGGQGRQRSLAAISNHQHQWNQWHITIITIMYYDYESFTTMHIYMWHVIDCESVIRDAGW